MRTRTTRPEGAAWTNKALPAVLYLAAFALFIVALVELTDPAHPVHATLAIAAGAALWFAGEAMGR